MHLLLLVFTILGPYSVQGFLERAGSIYYPSENALISRNVVCARQWHWPRTSPQSYTREEVPLQSLTAQWLCKHSNPWIINTLLKLTYLSF